MPSPKDGTNDQWGLASSTGARAGAGAAFATVAAGDGAAPLVDLEGRQHVVPIGGSPVPGFATPWQESAAVLSNDAQVIAGAAVLEQISGFVAAASDVAVNYVQIYDLAATPAAEVPLQTIRIVGSQVWSWSPQRWQVATGVRFVVSSSALSFVAGDTAFYNALGWQP